MFPCNCIKFLLSFWDFLFEKHILGIVELSNSFQNKTMELWVDNRSVLPYALCNKSFGFVVLTIMDKLGIALQAMVVKQQVVSIFVMSIICNY